MPFVLTVLTPIFTFLTGLVSKTLIVAIGLAAAKILAWIGIGYITYSGLVFGVDYFVAIIQSELSLLPEQFLQLINAVATELRLNSAMSIILSAYAVKMAIFTSRKSFFSSSNATAGG